MAGRKSTLGQGSLSTKVRPGSRCRSDVAPDEYLSGLADSQTIVNAFGERRIETWRFPWDSGLLAGREKLRQALPYQRQNCSGKETGFFVNYSSHSKGHKREFAPS